MHYVVWTGQRETEKIGPVEQDRGGSDRLQGVLVAGRSLLGPGIYHFLAYDTPLVVAMVIANDNFLLRTEVACILMYKSAISWGGVQKFGS